MTPADIYRAASSYGRPRFVAWLAFIGTWEAVVNKAGQVVSENVPGDGGGRTFFGIDEASHLHFPFSNPTPGEVAKVYLDDYWVRVQADSLRAPVGEVVANYAVNCGPGRAGLWLQQACNASGATLAEDGRIGPRTVVAANFIDPAKLSTLLVAIGAAYYTSIAVGRLAKFGNGWANRNQALAQFVTSYSPLKA